MESQYRPLVSIIIPVYKAEDYIGKCIESLQIKHIVIYKLY